MQPFEAAGGYGKEFVDSSLKSFASLSRGMQAIAAETAEYSKKSFEEGSAVFEKLIGAKSLEKAVEIQSDYAKQSYESLVSEMTKLGEMYADMAKDAYKPFETAVAKVK